MTRKLSYGVAETGLGRVLLITSVHGLVALAFVDECDADEALAELQLEFSGAEFEPAAAAVAEVGRQIERYASGDLGALESIEIDLSGTPFQLQVWRALMEIEPGEPICYSDLAGKMGCPGSTRAVASAVAANRVALVIPCHRVVRKGGAVGEFRWGSSVKERLLEHERSVAGRAEPLAAAAV